MEWRNCNICKMSWMWEELKHLQDLCAKLWLPLVLQMALVFLWIMYCKIICYKDIECWCVACWQWHQRESTDILQNWSWIGWFSWPGLLVSDSLPWVSYKWWLCFLCPSKWLLAVVSCRGHHGYQSDCPSNKDHRRPWTHQDKWAAASNWHSTGQKGEAQA
jgi:hypothetical protein